MNTHKFSDQTKSSLGHSQDHPPAAGHESKSYYSYTTNFPELLEQLGVSLFATSYQAERLLVFIPNNGNLSMLVRKFPHPTGLAFGTNRMALASKYQLLMFRYVFDLTNPEGKKDPHDVCLTPRTSYITGDVQAHEVAFIGDEPHFINSRFNSISIPSLEKSFETVWRPKFISELVAEDRCHLNGIAVHDQKIHYLTCLAQSDVAGGWRDKKRDGGIIISYPDSEVVSHGISMPHSPRLYRGDLWVLNSGSGRLEKVDLKNGVRTCVAVLPGFLRGLAFAGDYAFVGLSLIREKHIFGGLEINENVESLVCAIYCLDLRNGSLAGFIQFTKGVAELFDVQVLQATKNPHVIGFEEDTINRIIVPG